MWKNAYITPKVILKLDDAGEVLALVVFISRRKWCAISRAGATLGYANSATAAMALVG